MAAFALNHAGKGSEQLAEPTPSFTAVNGSASPVPPARSRPDREPRETAKAPVHRLHLPNNQQQTPSPSTVRQGQSNNDSEHEHHEQRPSAAPLATQALAQAQRSKPPTLAPVPIQPMEHPSSITIQQPDQQYSNGHSVDSSSQHPNTAVMSPQEQKRKHSYNGDPPHRQGYDHHSVYPVKGSPPSLEGQQVHKMDYSPCQSHPPLPESYHSPPQDTYAAHPQMRDNPPERLPRPERHQLIRKEYNQPAPRSYYADHRETRLANALQGNGDNLNSQKTDWGRRRRVFSSRTRTGCMTCRGRKKKCDEQHPACNNCLRSNYYCEGYTMPSSIITKAPIPVQTKHGYPSQGTPSLYPPTSRYNEVGPEYPGPPPQQMQHCPSRDQADRGKPINVEDERDGLYGSSKPPASTQQFAYASHFTVPHPPNHNNTPPDHNNLPVIAQAAATHPVSLCPSPQRRNEQYTEREKMLKGLYYYPLSPALIQDREQCIAAIWRFNNTTNPSHGASPEERCRLFRHILSLRPTPEPADTNGEVPRQNVKPPFGSVGERVVVEAPFYCDYGYNIAIGDDVLIGADCRISDICSIIIGARCVLGPNVKLVCATYSIDPRRRMGSSGPALGRNIVIEEDCWIGSNVTILAGVKVGKSSTVGAGSLLHQDIPNFTVVTGNPAKVSRGIYDAESQ